MLDELFSPLDVAIYETVNGFQDPATGKRGAVALAPMLGKAPGTLSNKANPEQNHQLTLRESIPLQLVARNFAMVSLVNDCGLRVVVRAVAMRGETPIAVLVEVEGVTRQPLFAIEVAA